MVPNLGKHGRESIRDTSVSLSVDECFVLALDVLWIERAVETRARDTIREL